MISLMVRMSILQTFQNVRFSTSIWKRVGVGVVRRCLEVIQGKVKCLDFGHVCDISMYTFDMPSLFYPIDHHARQD